jgi:hypothetical protein
MTIYKNNEILEHMSITLTVGPHQITPYGFWRHTNIETIFLNTATNNWL